MPRTSIVPLRHLNMSQHKPHTNNLISTKPWLLLLCLFHSFYKSDVLHILTIQQNNKRKEENLKVRFSINTLTYWELTQSSSMCVCWLDHLAQTQKRPFPTMSDTNRKEVWEGILLLHLSKCEAPFLCLRTDAHTHTQTHTQRRLYKWFQRSGPLNVSVGSPQVK